ncbi:hypothetical protein ACLMJK_008709 [Lecanora helva]
MSGGCCHSHGDKSSNRRGAIEERKKNGVKKAAPTSTVAVSASKGISRLHLNKDKDAEKGFSSGNHHVDINITGMTCTGCCKKGLNALNRMAGVRCAKINFMASTGEFDLDARLDPAEAISQFERETGFRCSRFMKDLQKLNVVMSKSEAKWFEENLPIGVESICKVDTNIHSIAFNPVKIGARSVLSFVPSGTLARPRDNDADIRSKQRLVAMACSTVCASLCTVPVAVMAWSDTGVSFRTRSIVSLVLASIVQVIAILEFYIGAFKALVFSRVIEMDMLVAISVTAAYGYSVVAFALTNRGYVLEQGEIFETSTLLTTLILLGRLITMTARTKAMAAIAMESLQAETALLVNKRGKVEELDAQLLEYGDTIVIPPHTRIVTDGEITLGSSIIDESMITGESRAIKRTIGDSVTAGTLNLSSPITIRLTRLPGKNSVNDIAYLVKNALEAKPRLQNLADKVAGWFTPVVVVIACLVLAIWLIVGLKLRKYNVGGSLGLSISYSITVLAISCPCAVGLAVPLVLIIAGSVAAKSGVIIKESSVTEGAFRTTDVVFDKTGTITQDDLQVVEEVYYDHHLQHGDFRSRILSLLENNRHPVSSAVARRLRAQSVKSMHIEGIRSIPGCGIQALWKGKTFKAGNPYWLGIDACPEIRRIMERGLTMLAVTIDATLIATYALDNSLRKEATAVINNLHQRKITCHLVSGDGAKVVENVAREAGIDQCNVASCQTPYNKKQYVKQLMDQGRTVLFCGDGTNDAVAVAQAHVGAQIGARSDITKATAGVVLMGGLEGIPALLDISRQAYKRIIFNFVWSGVYNSFAILLAAGAFVKVRIPPAYAGLGEIISVLPLVLVAMTLVRYRRQAL